MSSRPAPSPARLPAAAGTRTTVLAARPLKPLRLGTRGSMLARAQSQQFADALTSTTGRQVDLVTITTHGDTCPAPLAQIGGTGVFVSALREALLDGAIDFAVHSLKDLPTAAPDRLALAAVPAREDPRDALVARDGLDLDALAAWAAQSGQPVRIGTGSPRRAAQLRLWAAGRGHAVEVVPIRGNVDTRIDYVRTGRLDAVVLAAAGLRRLGRLGEAGALLDTRTMLPAPGQGALAIECRAADTALTAELSLLDHAPTRAAVTAERALLAALEAGCSAPVGALATLRGADPAPAAATTAPATAAPELGLRALVGGADGVSAVQAAVTRPLPPGPARLDAAAALGGELARLLLAAGASRLP